jgi:hypothetical protein
MSPQVAAEVTASGATGDDINLLVMTETNAVIWSGGHAYTAQFEFGPTTTASIDLRLGLGTFCVIYDNRFSTVSDKDVATRVDPPWDL